MNGIDIYEKVDMALVDYKAGNYYEFGLYVGMAMNEVFMKAPEVKVV